MAKKKKGKKTFLEVLAALVIGFITFEFLKKKKSKKS